MSAPILVGIAGGSAAGKTTVARAIAAQMSDVGCVILGQDSYYRDLSHIPLSERQRANFDHPAALESELLAAHLAELRAGRAIDVPVYDFVEHVRRAETRALSPASFVLVDGLFALCEPSVRAHLDFKVFVDADEGIRRARRIARDVSERGRTEASVLEQLRGSVLPMHAELIEPSRHFADVVLGGCGDDPAALADLVARLRRIHGLRA